MSHIDAQLRLDLLTFQQDFLQDGQAPMLTKSLTSLRQRVDAAARQGLLSRQTMQLGSAIVGRTRDSAMALSKSNQVCSEVFDDLKSRLRDLPDDYLQRGDSERKLEPSNYFSTPPCGSSAGRDTHRGRKSDDATRTGGSPRDVEDITECKAWCEKNWRHLYPDVTTIRALALACNAPVARIQTWFSAYRKNSGFNALDAHFQAKGVDLRDVEVGHDRRLTRADEAKIACYRGKLSAGGERDFIASTLASVTISSDEEEGSSRSSYASRGHPARRDAVPLPARSKAGVDPTRRLSLAPTPDRASFAFYPPAHLTRVSGDRSSGQPSPTSSNPSPTSSEYGWSGSDSAYSTDATAASMYDERLSQSRRCPSPSYGRPGSSAGSSYPAGRRSSFSGPPSGGLPSPTSPSLYGHPQPPSPQSSRMSASGSRGPVPLSARGYGGR